MSDAQPAELKSIEYYALNPGEMPTDAESLAKLADTMDDNTDLAAGASSELYRPSGDSDGADGAIQEGRQDGGTGKAADGGDGGEQAADEGDQDLQGQGGKKPVIKAADQTSEIPYSVLERSRETVAQLAAENNDLRLRLERLEQAGVTKEAIQDAIDDQQKTGADVFESLKARITELSDDFPENIFEPTTVLADQVKQLADLVKSIQSTGGSGKDGGHAGDDQQQQHAAPDAPRQPPLHIMAAIDAVPELANIRDNDPDRWKEAGMIDDQLKQRPEYEGVSLVDRFRDVLKVMNGEAIPDRSGRNPDDIAREKSDEELRREVLAKIEKSSAARNSVPTSHEDLPSGAPHPRSEIERVDNMSEHELAQMFSGMSGEQVQQYLAKAAG